MRYGHETLLPEGAFKPVGKKMSLHGGGSAPSTSSGPMTSTNFTAAVQPELLPYATNIAQQAQNLSAAQYTPYSGQRIADFTPLQQQQQSDVANLQTPQQFGQASAATQTAGLGALQAGQNYAQQATDPNAMQAYMSPYWQNAVDAQKQGAIQDYNRQMPYQQAQATAAGAFGGNRQGVQQAISQDNLNRQLGQIEATGAQNAFQNAQQSQQFGASLGLQGLGQATQAAGQLGQIGATQNATQLNNLNAQGQVGGQQQALQQQDMTQQYQDFLKQQEYPYSQLAFYNSMIRGTAPMLPTTTQTYTAAPSTANQIASLGLGAYGLSSLTGKAGGGVIQKFAGGGSVGESPEAQYQRAKFAPVNELHSSLQGQGPFAADIAMMAQQYQQQMRTGSQGVAAQQQAHQPTVRERALQEMGGSPVARPEMQGQGQGIGTPPVDPAAGMADGGIVGFDEGGLTPYGNTMSAEEWKKAIADTRKKREAEDADTIFSPGSEALRAVGENAVRPFTILGGQLRRLPGGIADAAEAAAPKSIKYSDTVPTPASASQRPRVNIEEPPEVGIAKLPAAAAASAAGPKSGGKAKNSKAADIPYGGPDERYAHASAPSPSSSVNTEMDMDGLRKMASGIGDITSPEMKAWQAAEEARQARIEGGKEDRKSHAIGLAALQAAAGFAGSSTFMGGLSKAFTAAAEVGKDYKAHEEALQDKMDEAHVQSAQALLMLKRGDVQTGMKMLETATTQKIKLAELDIDARYKDGEITAKMRANEIAKLHIDYQKPLWDAMARFNDAHGAALGAMASNKGQLTPAQAMAASRGAASEAQKEFKGNEMAMRRQFPGMKDVEILDALTQKHLANQFTAAGRELPAGLGALQQNPAWVTSGAPPNLRQGMIQ